MPETFFRVEWPDGSADTCYSPSTIIERHLDVARSYSVEAFLASCRTGLQAASDRVRAVHGIGCSRAMAQLGAIEAKASSYAGHPDAHIIVAGFARSRQEA